MRTLVLVVLLGSFCLCCKAEVWQIPGQIATLQEAIEVAQNGDVIELADGEYTGSGFAELEYGGKAITVRSQSGVAENCTIKEIYGSFVFGFFAGEGPESILENISIENSPANVWVAGLAPCTPTIRGCRFLDKTLGTTSAIYIRGEYANPSFTECTFSNCRIHAVYVCMGAVELTDCRFLNDGVSGGGALGTHYNYTTNVNVRNCTFAGHGSGGVVSLSDNGAYEFEGCYFTGNIGSVLGVSGDDASLTLSNCTFAANYNQIYSSAIRQTGDTTTRIENCLFWDNCSGGQLDIWLDSGSCEIECTIIDLIRINGDVEPIVGDNVFNADPLFCDPISCVDAPSVEGGFEIQGGSPCFMPAECGLIGAGAECSSASIDENTDRFSSRIELLPHPNPSTGIVTLRIMLPDNEDASLEVLDLNGRVVWSRRVVGAVGPIDIEWNRISSKGIPVPAGIYFTRLSSRQGVVSRQVSITR